MAEKLGISSATWPIFGVIWPSGYELAHYISKINVANKRILEVGCGIGLASLLLNHIHADISATDVHPNTLEFLYINTLLNNDRIIPFERLDWKDTSRKLGKFDLIIGSDLLYESKHAQLLSKFIDQHANKSCEVIIVDPQRGQQGKFIKKMISFGFSQDNVNVENIKPYNKLYKHTLIKLIRKS